MSEEDARIEEVRKRAAARWEHLKLHYPKTKNNYLYWVILTVISAIATIFLGYGALSFNRPEIISQAIENMGGTISIVVGFSMVGFILATTAGKMAATTFEKRRDDQLLSNYYSTGTIKSGNDTTYTINPIDTSEKPEEKITAPPNTYSYGAASQDSHFEQYTSEILRSLSAYASSSEQTAERLLDKGVLFMTIGLGFYVFAIIIWQFVANLTSPDPHVMYIGMAACSMTFIVIEFLAAWFFKQYRYYVEVSLSCLRVRSVYDRYLLGYYALKAFNEENNVSSRDKMMDVLKEDVNWPTYKGSSANDFNYMMESMGAAHTSLEKIRKIFKDSGKGKAQ